MITLLFSSHDGMQTLPAMLERLTRIRHPRDLRIVAIDNGSTDGTGDALRQAATRLPMDVWRLPAAGRGRRLASKNGALNWALERMRPRLADSELVVVSDDDVLPCEGWLIELEQAARDAPQADVFGGTIVPYWLAAPPAWLDSLEDCFPILFAATTASDGPCNSHDVYGPNMAVRGRIFANGVRFDPRIGPDGGRRFGMGSESELLRRLERAGHRFVFRAAAQVEHQVKPRLLELSSVLERAWRYGYGRAMMDGQRIARASQLGAALSQRLVREVKSVAATLPCFEDRRLRMRFWREVARGYLAGALTSPLRGDASGQRLAPVATTRATRGSEGAQELLVVPGPR